MGLTYISTPLDITTSDTPVTNVDITSGIDGTYNEYLFEFVNIHPSALQEFCFQVDTGENTSYNQPITSTFFEAAHAEDDGGTPAVFYEGNHDQANADEVFQHLSSNFQSASNDSSLSGSMTLFDPSSSTYVKHFMATTSYFQQDPAAMVAHTAGYVNTTTALTRIRFKMDSGNIDAGVIKMYGVG